MYDFALVTEGPTDHVILKNILLGYFNEQREPDVHREHPDPQAEARYGGWTLLLNYLKTKKFREAAQLHRYLIVQVDTDVCEEPGFDVPRQDENGVLIVEVLVERVIERLRTEIGAEDWAEYGEQFIFAIAVHEMECWVLPLWATNRANAGKIAGCIGSLGHCPELRTILKQRRFPWIRREEKDCNSYHEASKYYQKPKTLAQEGRKNPSLRLFLDCLDEKNIVLPPLE